MAHGARFAVLLTFGCVGALGRSEATAPTSSPSTLAGRARAVSEDDPCIDDGDRTSSCSLGLLQKQQPTSATAQLEGEPTMPMVEMALLDEFIRKLNASDFSTPPSYDPADGCPIGQEADRTRTEDPDMAIKAYNFADPSSWLPTELCANGAAQSPINISPYHAVRSTSGGRLQTAYTTLTHRDVTNTGHNLQVIGNFGTLTLPDGRSFEASQYHIHAPSEHTVDLKYSAMELHMVHTNPQATQEKYAVLGILFDIGAAPNQCIEQMLKTVPRYGCKYPIGTVDFNACFEYQLNGPWWNYRGSFTTPPCTEGVQFNIMQRKASITLDQYVRFKKLAYGDPANNRPLQPVNGRIFYYEPRF